MTRALPRASLYSASLVRFLTENAMLAPARQAEDVGQKLGDWLDFRQAIALHGVLNPETAPHQPSAATPPHVRRMALIAPEALARHVDKVRAQLVESITRGAPVGSGLARIDMPAPVLDEPVEIKTAFEPYRRFISAHQRQMESTLRSLRAQLRLQLSQRASAGQPLAALDGAFENILAEREAALLGKTSKLLEKRFVQALKAHMQVQAQALAVTLAAETAMATDEDTDPIDAMASAPNDTPKADPSSWLMPLRQTIRQALLAELDTRLQPTLGLLEALTSIATQKQ
ncbi:DUF3348 family protein [Limnohabitans sp. Bal53]|uniref:DUF3348 family protein n=1 Tax=Limnohabitans sp. Bal53 TaxID=1977910 RepID=UPI000D39BD68|nr:DUF3348 family protein [Limnohabitans sp. Bal53]PUE41826.1 hypothetical protein B9Z50_09205 [Limnohabitans sp. Bal53]